MSARGQRLPKPNGNSFAALTANANLYYAKNGQRQCRKCKQNLGKEYRRLHREQLKKARREKIRKTQPRKQKSLRIQIIRKEKADGGVKVEGADV